MSSAPKFSIITTCKGRLDHLKQTLPDMVRQESAEVIVVDFSCPQGAASYVESTFPTVRVVKVENKDYYAHCEARNAGAAVARGEWLLFCDADIDLAATCTQWLSKTLRPDDFGRFAKWHELKRHKPTGGGLGVNNLEGFQVLERRDFERFRGYDIRLRGYGAGGDMELCQRAVVFGLRIVQLDESIVKAVISHGDDLRQTHAKESWLNFLLARILLLAPEACLHQTARPEPFQRTLRSVHRIGRRGDPSVTREAWFGRHHLSCRQAGLVTHPHGRDRRCHGRDHRDSQDQPKERLIQAKIRCCCSSQQTCGTAPASRRCSSCCCTGSAPDPRPVWHAPD